MKEKTFYLIIYLVVGITSILYTYISSNRFNDFVDVANLRTENYESNIYSKQKYILISLNEINNRLLAIEAYTKNYKDTVYIKQPIKKQISVTEQDTIIIQYVDETKKPKYIERGNTRIRIYDSPKRILE